MKQYNKYLVRSTDQFDPVNFSSVADEIQLINEETVNLPPLFKVEILISFLKNTFPRQQLDKVKSRANTYGYLRLVIKRKYRITI